jgi:hypothetical protein
MKASTFAVKILLYLLTWFTVWVYWTLYVLDAAFKTGDMGKFIPFCGLSFMAMIVSLLPVYIWVKTYLKEKEAK